MIYKCSVCGQEYEKEPQCQRCEEHHRSYDSPILFDKPNVYEGYFSKEYGDYGPSFIGLDGKQILGEGSASHLITYSNINSFHALDDYKGRPMRITVNAEFLDGAKISTPNKRENIDKMLTAYYNSGESANRS